VGDGPDRRRFLTLLLTASVMGCGRPGVGPRPLRVAAADDLRQAIPILAVGFRHGGGAEVDASSGTSGELAGQIRQGAPFDVFLSADRKSVDDLAGQGLIRPDSVRPYARGRLVMVVNRLSAAKVESMADLARPEVARIAIADPGTEPYGIAARQALTRSDLWGGLGSKIVRAETAGRALQLVRSGRAEVGFVGRAIADVREARIVPIPAPSYDPIVQCLGIVSGTGDPAGAGSFVDFVLGEVGQGMLRDLGFSRAPRASG